MFLHRKENFYILTRMKTSIKNEAPSPSWAEKIAFPPKPDRHTDIHTDGHKKL